MRSEVTGKGPSVFSSSPSAWGRTSKQACSCEEDEGQVGSSPRSSSRDLGEARPGEGFTVTTPERIESGTPASSAFGAHTKRVHSLAPSPFRGRISGRGKRAFASYSGATGYIAEPRWEGEASSPLYCYCSSFRTIPAGYHNPI